LRQQFSRRKRFRTVCRAESMRRPLSGCRCQFEVSVDCLVRDNAESLGCRAQCPGARLWHPRHNRPAARASDNSHPCRRSPARFLLPLLLKITSGYSHSHPLRPFAAPASATSTGLGETIFQVPSRNPGETASPARNAAEGNQKEAADDQVFEEQMLSIVNRRRIAASDQMLRPCVAANNLRPVVGEVRRSLSTIGRPVPRPPTSSSRGAVHDTKVMDA